MGGDAMSDRKKNIAIIDALNNERALDDADKAAQRQPTPEEQASIDRMRTNARALLREQREKLRKEAAENTKSREQRSIPAKILGMTRDAILQRLREIQSLAEPDTPIAVQARKLDELSDGDLQWLLAKFEEELGGESDGS